MNTSNRTGSISIQHFRKSKNVDRCVVLHYEQLVRDTEGFFTPQKGSNYRIAPAVGTSRLLIRSRAGAADPAGRRAD